ncbi:shikimate dehydrogenase [Devosia sp. RR2S18]|uniref:shikimate dehydrogenase n=1 Tax=Devosia rhizosphaerae TaxID=3049774 RepID=UPI00253FF132|nr:shikimate dehydrogenase [Devosia sp. RR2S18]WIJ25066.1 shikimate dehydrogenase [Devosia sp. RR2S18]
MSAQEPSSYLSGLRAQHLHPTAENVTIGLVGRGIAGSLSPLMHEQEGARLGLAYKYHLIDFDQLGYSDSVLGDVVQAAHASGFSGLNVTYPFKQAVLSFLDELSPEASSIGAVNTVVFGSGLKKGFNTDVWGFAESFRRSLGDVRKDRVLQIGAGGAGAAVAHALVALGARNLDIVDKDLARAESLLSRLGLDQVSGRALHENPADLSGYSGVVNATPVGMTKFPGVPVEPDGIAPDQWVADVVYFPRETALVQKARSRGSAVLSGGGMAIFQAVRALELFTGRAADVKAMTKTFEEAVASSG